jgi:hypothetical protein
LRRAREVHIVVCLHIQDEAGLALRSFLAENQAKPSRSRTTKVQSHVMQLSIDGVSMDFPMELDALCDKKANTLATSLIRARDTVLNVVLRGVGPNPSGEVWFWHVIVGDGVGTNGRAGRIIAAAAQEKPPGNGVLLYFMWVVVCAAHMSNLVTKNAVHGPAALLAARESKAVRGAEDAITPYL